MGMVGRSTAVLIGVAALFAAAGAAQAAEAPAPGKPVDFTVRPDPAAAIVGGKALKLDARRGRWGVTLNLQQPDTRASNWNDIQAGAYYKITPSLRVGGAFALGDQSPLPGPKPATPEAGQPRVALEGKFKF